MTTVFREIPSNYWLLLYSTDENSEKVASGSGAQKESNPGMPPSVAKLLEKLTSSNDCQFLYRKQSIEENSGGQLEDFCQWMPSNHYHILLYLPHSAGGEKLIKQSVSQTLSKVHNAKVKLLTVTYPENFSKAETSIFCDESVVVRGERMQKLIKAKTSVSLGCSFVDLWELEKNNSLGNCADSEKALYVFQKLLELEKSDAPFKDTIISYIDLLQRGVGRFFVSEHRRTMDIDLGASNASSVPLSG